MVRNEALELPRAGGSVGSVICDLLMSDARPADASRTGLISDLFYRDFVT